MTPRRLRVKVGERWFTVEIEDLTASPVKVMVDGETYLVEVAGLPQTPSALPRPPAASPSPPTPASNPHQSGAVLPSAQVSEKLVRAPMAGRVMSVNVRPGDPVTSGQELCVLEAMKMEQSIRAPQDGVVKTIHVAPMQQVVTNAPLVELE